MADIVLAAINAKWIHPSTALRLLKANLGALEGRCEIIEFALRQNQDEKTAALLRARPRILGLSVSIWNHAATLELLAALSGLWEVRPLIVLGGPELRYLEESAEIFSYADYVIRGEGEKIFAELCQSIFAKKAAPLLPPGRFINADDVDLSAIDPGYRLYTEEDLSSKLIYVEASRGCPFECAFCQSAIKSTGTDSGGRPPAALREFPLDRFLENMDILLDRMNVSGGGKKPRVIKFLDRSFNAAIPRATAIMEFFLARCEHSAHNSETDGPRFQVHFEIVPSLLPPQLKNLIVRFPPETLRLELGIQSLNQKVCAAVKRFSDPEKELENLRFLRTRTNAAVHADLIAGLPGEDLDSFGEGFDRLWITLTEKDGMNKPFEIQSGILKGLPGTPLRRLDSAFGQVYSPRPPYEVEETAAMNRTDLDRIKNYARFWELIVNRNPRPELLPRIVPAGRPVFRAFMELADGLLRHFKKNWGINRDELFAEISREISG